MNKNDNVLFSPIFVLKAEPQGCPNPLTSRSPPFTTTFQSFRARLAGHLRHIHSLTLMHIHLPIHSHTLTLSPTGSTSPYPYTGRPQGRGRTCLVQRTLRTKRIRRKRRLQLPSGRGLNLYLKLIRNMLKVSSHIEYAVIIHLLLLLENLITAVLWLFCSISRFYNPYFCKSLSYFII